MATAALESTLESSHINVDVLEYKIHHGGFTVALKEECERLAGLVQHHQLSLELAAKALFAHTHKLAKTDKIRSVHTAFATLQDLKQQNLKSVQDCLTLQDYFSSNRTTLLAVAERADKRSRTGEADAMVRMHLSRAHLHSSLVCVVSDTFEALRQAEQKIMSQDNAGTDAMWQAPSSFERETTKYWVKDENLTKLMMTCAAEAPLLVYGKKGPLTSTTPRDLKTSDGDKLWDSLATRITSIYFDSASMGLYKERIKRSEGAQLLRVRWYGPKMPTGDKVIFVELKTHHEKWVANKSVKERALVLERDMVQFLQPVKWTMEDARAMILRAKPKMKADEIPKATALLMRMHNLVVQHNLTACVRSVYDRAAFQSSTSNDLRLTLDRNVTLVDERVESFANSGKWCLSDGEAETARARLVPFNVFEIKLASDNDMPAGLANAVQDSTLVEAPKFSKFLSGAAAFNMVPTLPYWAAHSAFYSYFDLSSRGVPPPSSEASGEYALLNAVSSGTLPDGVAIAPRKPPRVEPKTIFANERTFIQWISASTLLLSIAGFMMNAGSDFRATSAIISLSAFGLMIYSTTIYFQRLHKLKERHPQGYYNKVAPIVLTCVVGVAVFLVFSDTIKGSDIFLFKPNDKGRRLRNAVVPVRRMLQKKAASCSPIVSDFGVSEVPSSLLVDSKRNAVLVTWKDSVYSRFIDHDGTAAPELKPLVTIHQSHLQGLADAGGRLFAVSDGSGHPELVELARANSPEERLRVLGRWTLEDKGQVRGFAFVPSVDSPNMGSFYIHMNSSVDVYSVPSTGDGRAGHPLKLKSLNMKVLNQGNASYRNKAGEHLSTMQTFEGITYILNTIGNVLVAWDLTDGAFLSQMKLPVAASGTPWTDFSLGRKAVSSTEIPQLRGNAVVDDGLFLHLTSHSSTNGGQLWSFPVKAERGLFSIPECQTISS